ncbi:hypothetical protein [Proteiniphilum acetatigenes]|uniref:hypothetical protein n=1 Tax=Proteiniphilum acetatigenes TaxID=294710 RepID=UPI000380B462|nr:hypothetical protein [Proteiniphilum acetatigenes]SFK28866.1 hypothetical protein SAMN05216357_101163 [Porphyromonadaceae bacterium KH3CP3RA]
MKKIGVLLSAVLLLSLYTTVYASDLTKSVQGTWTAKVADAPYGYQDYQVTIKQVEGKCVADITGSQLNVKNQELKEADGKLTTTVYAGENVKVVIWKEKNKVKGTADTSMGKLPIQFTRKQESKQ